MKFVGLFLVLLTFGVNGQTSRQSSNLDRLRQQLMKSFDFGSMFGNDTDFELMELISSMAVKNLENPTALDSTMTMIENRVFRIFNISAERKELMKEVGDIIQDSLLEQYKIAKNSTDWSNKTSNEQLRKVIMDTMMDGDFYMRRQLVNSTKISTMLENNEWIAQCSEELEKKNSTALKGRFGVENADLILDTYNETLYYTKMADLAGDWNQISPVQKFMFTAAALNYTAIIENQLESMEDEFKKFVGDLKNKTDVSGDIKQTIEKLREMVMRAIKMINPRMNVMNFNIDNLVTELSKQINTQLTDMYHRLSNDSSSFSQENSIQQVLMLLTEYDYTKTGLDLSLPILRQIDEMLPTTIKFTLEMFISAMQHVDVSSVIGDLIKRLPGMKDQELITKTADIFILISNNMNKTALDNISEYKNESSGPIVKLAYIITTLPEATLKKIGGNIGDIMLNILPNLISQGISDQIPVGWVDVLNRLKTAANQGDEEFYVAMYMIFNTTIPQNMITSRIITHPAFTGSLVIASNHIRQVYLNLTQTVSGFPQMNIVMQAVAILGKMDWVEMTSDISAHAGSELKKVQQYMSAIMNPPVNDQCGKDLAAFRSSLSFANFANPTENWGWKMVDAFGKPGSDILDGGLVWAGSKTECKSTKGRTILPDNSTRQWGTNYCIAKLEMPPSIFPAQPGAGNSKFSIGVCLPESCHKEDLILITKFTDLAGINTTDSICFDELPANSGAGARDPQYILAWCIIGFFVALTVVCSTIDRVHYIRLENSQLNSKDKKLDEGKIELKYVTQQPDVTEPNVYLNGAYEKDHEIAEMNDKAHSYNVEMVMQELPEKPGMDDVSKEKSGMNGYVDRDSVGSSSADSYEEVKPQKPKEEKSVLKGIVKAFSVFNNLSFLLNTTERPGSLKGLNGIRFLSMSWVIIGHVYALPLTFQPMAIKNPMGALAWAKDWQFMAIMSGLFAVDSFFLLSGLLVGYLFLKMMDKINGKLECMHMILYYVHRYLRLTPLLAAVILIVVGFSHYTGWGPFMVWENNDNHLFCEKRWWASLLYVNNFAYSKEPCIGWIWYLANDMQFYIISPLMLIPLYKKRIVGFIIIGVLMAVHWGTTIYLWATMKSYRSQMTGNPTSFDEVYIKPYTRIGPYLIGIILAYILFKKYTIKTKIAHAIGWTLSIGMIAFLVYIPWDDIKDQPFLLMDGRWNRTQRIFYETFSKTAWGIALGWIIYACNNNAAGVVGDILNWSGWAPLSKLTYSAYLVHPILQLIDLYNVNQPMYMDHYDQIKQFIIILFSSYSGGAILHLLFEAPMAGIEKLILPRS